MEAISRVETTRLIRSNERVIESQRKAMKESEEQIIRQQSELIAVEQRVKSLRLELDDLVRKCYMADFGCSKGVF
jgi:hypothetical protein